MLRAYKYILKPNKEQTIMINKHLGCARWVYNWALNKKVAEYVANKKHLSRFDLQKELPQMKHNEDTQWLGEVTAQSLQASLENLDKAFTKFFKEKKGFPKFKSKHNNRQSFSYPQNAGVSFETSTCYLPKIGWVKTVFSREFKGQIKTCTISKTPTGKYFISILVDTGTPLPEPRKINPDTTIGIDTGIKTFAVCSDGRTFENHKYLKKSLDRLKVLQRRASKKKKGSSNRKKTNIKVAKYYEKVTNQRLDHIHKVTHALANDSQISAIAIEDLNLKGMMQNHKLAQALSDVSIGRFYEILGYKCVWNGINLLKIGRWDASSKTCNKCGAINKDLVLADREWTCICGVKHDRDVNASINIKNFALHPKNKTTEGIREASVEVLALVKPVKQKNVV